MSQGDELAGESNSITNQKAMLAEYAAKNGFTNIRHFSDDGHSGVNFERPQVKALLDLVRRGSVQNIVVKDLSRWGRNYPEVNKYLDQIFPFLGVRFISVNDQYDSETHKWQTAPMSVAFLSLIDRIIVFERGRIEIRFVFADSLSNISAQEMSDYLPVFYGVRIAALHSLT